MMRIIARITAFILALGLGLGANAATAQLVAGKDYRLVNPPQQTDSGSKVEVLEFFWYGCPHCNSLQKPLQTWLSKKPADVEFKRVPAVFQDSWMPLTKAFYAIEAMGLVDRLHHDIFTAIHQQKVRMNESKVLFDWMASKGVDRQKFIDTYNSFAVQGRTQRSVDLTRKYDIPGTPALTVDGKYLTAPSMVLNADNSINYELYFQKLDQVIALARKSRGGK